MKKINGRLYRNKEGLSDLFNQHTWFNEKKFECVQEWNNEYKFFSPIHFLEKEGWSIIDFGASEGKKTPQFCSSKCFYLEVDIQIAQPVDELKEKESGKEIDKLYKFWKSFLDLAGKTLTPEYLSFEDIFAYSVSGQYPKTPVEEGIDYESIFQNFKMAFFNRKKSADQLS